MKASEVQRIEALISLCRRIDPSADTLANLMLDIAFYI